MFASSLLGIQDIPQKALRRILARRSASPRGSALRQRAIVAACRIPRVRSAASKALITYYATATAPRPRPLSMVGDYASWVSLTDRSYSSRHLPPAPDNVTLPPESTVDALFERTEFAPSTDTSVTFMFFAQWFTDSFLRTDRSDFRKNTSNHGIDFCQIYGLNETKTRMLRAGVGGRLKSQLIDGAEFPQFLFCPRESADPAEPLVIKPEFEGLHDPDFLARIQQVSPAERHHATFAVGLEYGNSTVGHATFNIVFLREHNRIAAELAAAYPDWDDERLFQTTRNVMIVLLLELVIEEYIKHIGAFEFPLTIPDFMADEAAWNRPGWIPIEFDLLYRWHSMVPDTFELGAARLGPRDILDNNPLIIEHGVAELITAWSGQRAGRFGLHNTPLFLNRRLVADLPSVTEATTRLARKARLRPYNDYREDFGLPRLTDFAQLTADRRLQATLAEMYGSIDELEWYVGIWAEDYPAENMMGELMMVMVGYDAFTQALVRFDLDHMDDNDNRLFGVTAQIAWVPKPSYALTLRTPLYLVRN